MNEEVKKQEFWNYQTPFYIFDTDVLAERIRKIRSVIGSRAEVCYAMKAVSYTHLKRSMSAIWNRIRFRTGWILSASMCLLSL